MSNATVRPTHATRIQALEAGLAELRAGQAEILSILRPTAPAKAAVAPKASAKKATPKDEGFVTWLRETAPARAERKASNATLAAEIRALGFSPAGSVWDAYKAGERKVATLKRLAAKDAKARAAK